MPHRARDVFIRQAMNKEVSIRKMVATGKGRDIMLMNIETYQEVVILSNKVVIFVGMPIIDIRWYRPTAIAADITVLARGRRYDRQKVAWIGIYFIFILYAQQFHILLHFSSEIRKAASREISITLHAFVSHFNAHDLRIHAGMKSSHRFPISLELYARATADIEI